MFGDSNDWSSVEYLSSNFARPTLVNASRVLRPQGSRPSSYAGSYGGTFERASGAWIPKYIKAGATDASISSATGGKVKYMISGLIGPLIVAAINQLEDELSESARSQAYKNFKAGYKKPTAGKSADLVPWEWMMANSTNELQSNRTVLQEYKKEQRTDNVTANGIRALQAVHGATVDGDIGPETYKKLGLPEPYGNPQRRSSSPSSSENGSVAPQQKFYQKRWVRVVGGIAFVGILAAILFAPKGK